MATDVSSISKAAQDQILDAIAVAQSAIVDAVKTWSSTVAGILPAMPEVPGMDKLPKPAETVEMGFGFAERLLASQREFAEKLLGATQAPAASAKPKA